jgi:hypothetical protein
VVALFGLWFALMLMWSERTIATAGVYECENGLWCRTGLGGFLLPWEALAGFEHEGRAVYAARKSGGRARLLPVLQGVDVIWEAGRTRDIVGVLRQRLREK